MCITVNHHLSRIFSTISIRGNSAWITWLTNKIILDNRRLTVVHNAVQDVQIYFL